jgi:hypothetical protein
MSDDLSLFLTVFMALLCVMLFGRLVIGLAIVALVLFLVFSFSMVFLVVLIPIMIIGALLGRRINWDCDDWDWADDDDGNDRDNYTDIVGSNSWSSGNSRIIINGKLIKCDMCDSNASSVSNNRKRCDKHK